MFFRAPLLPVLLLGLGLYVNCALEKPENSLSRSKPKMETTPMQEAEPALTSEPDSQPQVTVTRE